LERAVSYSADIATAAGSTKGQRLACKNQGEGVDTGSDPVKRRPT